MKVSQHAREAVDRIVEDLNNRSGLGFNGVDLSDQKAIRAKWARIVQKAIVEAGPRSLIANEITNLRSVALNLLRSATPNRRDHPTMWKAWRSAEKVLGISDYPLPSLETDNT